MTSLIMPIFPFIGCPVLSIMGHSQGQYFLLRANSINTFGECGKEGRVTVFSWVADNNVPGT